MSLGDYIQRAPHEDTFRLKGVELWVPTDEQIAKARAKAPDMPVHVSLKVTYEPLTYRKYIGEDEIREETDYIRVTKGRGLSAGNEQYALQLVRDGGFPAIPADVRIQVPDPKRADADKQENAFKRFYVAAAKAGITLDVDADGSTTGHPGQIYTKQVGNIYACRNGAEQFPTVNTGPDGQPLSGKDFWNWSDTRSVFMRVPLREVNDFVQPEQIPERRYDRREDSGDGASSAPVTTTTAAAPVTSEALRAAVALLGIEGKTAGVINASAAALVASNIAKAPAVLGASVVNQAAMSGKFVDYLADQGVVAVQDGKVVLVG